MATESDNVNSGALGTVIAVTTVAFFGIALVVTALVRTEMSDEVEKKDVGADRAYKDLLAEQQAKLNGSPAFISRKKGTGSLPIERARELTLVSLMKDPNSATPPGPATGGAGGGAAAGTAGGGGGGGRGGRGGAGGSAGAGGATSGTSNPPPAVAPSGTVGAEKPPEAPKDKEKSEAEKKKAPKKAPTPPLPAPAAPPPAPAAPVAPNGQ
jgi:hypothetical protein